MPVVNEEMEALGFSPDVDVEGEMKGLGFEPHSLVGRTEDVFHRYMGALTTGLLGAAEGTARLVGAKKNANYLEEKGKEVRDYSRSHQNPLFDTSASSGVASALGSVTSLAPSMFVPGRFIPAVIGGAQAAANAYSSTRTRALEEGKNEEASNLEGLKEAGFVAATMPAYLIGGKLTSELAAKYLPATASALTRFAIGSTAAGAANVTTSAGIRALAGEPVIPQDAAGVAATLTQDLGFGLLHGYGESRLPDAVRNAVGQRKAVELNIAAADDMLATGKIDNEDHAHLQFRNKEYLSGLDQFIKKHQKLADAVTGKSESELDALQKELEAIDATPDESFNETQTKEPTKQTDSTTITDPSVSEPVSTLDPNAPVTTPTIPETVRVRANADPIFKKQAEEVYKLTGQEQLDYLAKNKLDPVDFGLEETVKESLTVPSEVAQVQSSVPINQPEAIARQSGKLDARIEVLNKTVKSVTKGWENTPEIITVKSLSDIPESALSPQDRQSTINNSVDGLVGRDGKVYLVGDKIPSVNRAKEVILHEVKGHYGLQGLFGKDISGYNNAMKSAWTEFQARPALLESFAKRAGLNSFKDLQEVYRQLDLETPEGRAKMSEELLSRAAELYLDPAKARPTWFNTVVAKIKVALQKVMPSMKLTDQDIVSLLSSGQKKLLDRSSELVEQGSTESIPTEPSLSATKEPAPAVHIGDQEFEGQKLPFFNLTRDIPGHVKDSTVSVDTLLEAGFDRPAGYAGGFDKANLPSFSMTGHAASDKILNELNTDANKLQTKFFDDLKALDVVEKGLNKGKRFDATMSAWTSALQSRNLANVMKGIFTDGMIQYNSSKGMFEKASDSMGMKAIFEPLTKAGLMDKWENYSKAKHAQSLVREKLGSPWQAVSNEEVKKLTGFTKDEANQWLKDGQSDPVVMKSHAEYKAKHSAPLRNFALQTGLISPQQKAAMDQLLDYVPFFREMDSAGGVRERGRSGLAGQSSGIKAFKGSQRDILPLLESITAQTSRIIDAGMKNIAAQRAVGVMQAAGVAERVPTATQPVSKNIQSIQSDLSKLGVEFNKLPQDAKDHLTALMYGPQKQTSAAVGDPNVVPVRVNGKLQYYKTEDPALTQALQSLSKPEENLMMRVLGKGKALQTLTATTNPGFAVANFIRDTLSTFVQSGDMGHLFRVGKGLVKAARQGEEVKAIQAAGSGGSAFLNIDPKSIRSVLKSDNFWQNRLNDKFFMKTLWDGWKQVLYAAENANRVAIYDKVLEKGGTTAEAAFQAQDTLNFQMHGASRSMQMLSAAIPFLNARMQGAYKIKRSFSEDPKGVALRGGLLVLGSLGLWALNKSDRSDEDENGKNWYERLSNNDKALYWHMKVPGTNEIVRMPKPFEMGTIFATIPEVMADAISDPKEAGRSLKIAATSTAQAIPVAGDFVANVANTGEVFQSMAAAFSGNPMIRPFFEIPANRNFFFNSPIVTNKDAPKEAQYSDRTSATARAIGETTGQSPQQVDYFINTIFSGLTPYVLLASDSIAKSAGYQGAMPKEVKDYLGIGRFTKDSETMPNRYSADFYDLKNDVEDTYARLRWMATNATEQDAVRKYADDNKNLISMKRPVQMAEKQLKSFKEQLSRIRTGSGSLEEKRTQEEAILKERTRVLATTMKYYQDLLEKKD